MKKNGLVLVHTGEGKGKTTAALGLALRAWGGGSKVLILQFIKGGWNYGELKAIEALGQLSGGEISVRQGGKGFTQRGGEKAEHSAAAQETLEMAKTAIASGHWDMIILDEINYAIKFGLIAESDVLDLIAKKPAELHLVLTGRDAADAIVERADLVTEMKLIKHPFQKGIKAQQGIEF